ncbi:MAG: hypothetical protein QJR12_01265 [Mycobacterium sp.]|uniref:hypothetical protein n=1 Tax=Mycobacterium sp. TaxID=1785 RepID=UPI00262B9D7D|nr:hypothetical protein [Mycobacterium sp.]MDI3312947.1 hypothetical protein [Mycobacterium sp.]
MNTPRVFSSQQRSEILDQQLMAMASHGGRVMSRADTWAVVARGRPVNHVLHLLLSLVTCSLWVPVWLLMTAFAGQRQRIVRVDEYGNVSSLKAPLEAHRVIAIIGAVIWLIWLLVFFFSLVSGFSHNDTSSSMGVAVVQQFVNQPHARQHPVLSAHPTNGGQ